ncbi:MAG: hypothetical protein FWG30_04600 [Eubacteriaceae bacterium]|jgi:hypothetical protein|nr:hypothetical protein [Eubacteriaceae bacterium]
MKDKKHSRRLKNWKLSAGWFPLPVFLFQPKCNITWGQGREVAALLIKRGIAKKLPIRVCKTHQTLNALCITCMLFMNNASQKRAFCDRQIA